MEAAKLLIEEGHITEDEIPAFDPEAEFAGYKPATPPSDFIDGIAYDGRDPIGYLNAHTIGNKD